MSVIVPRDSLELAIKAIKLPQRVILDDGREIKLRFWEPRIAVNEQVSVTLMGTIEMPDNKGDKNNNDKR